MAGDCVALMRLLGHDRFALVGQDRGAYVAQRLAADHTELVTQLVVMDAVPIGEALAQCDARFATSWWHWFFLGQTAKPAERVICADPDAYRAGLGIDRAHDDADRAAGQRIGCPTLIIWASRDDLESLWGDPVVVWRS